MRKIAIAVAVLFAAGLGAAGSASVAQAAPKPAVVDHVQAGQQKAAGQQKITKIGTAVGTLAWSCTAGYSCYYDGHGGTSWFWNAPSCGWHNLGTMNPAKNDRISSIYNRGGGAVQGYNWTDSNGWVAIGGPVYPGEQSDYWGGWDNVIDAVSIAC